MQQILNKYHHWSVIFLFLVNLINGIVYIPQQSITSDEGDNFNYAVRFVKGHPEKIKPFDDASAMPVSILNTIPRVVEQLLHPTLKKINWGYDDIMHGRYITFIISLLIGLYVYLWSKDLFGKTASFFSLLLFVFCPNISAHAGLVTTDIYSALFTIVPLYHFWKYSKQNSLRQFILFSSTLALAQLCKQSLTFLYPLFLLLFLLQALYKKNLKSLYSKLTLGNVLVFILIQLFILNAGFQFKGTGKPLAHYSFRSHFFQNVQQNFHFIVNFPLPVPSPYLEGLDCTKTIDEIGPGHPESSPRVYLLGKVKEGKGFRSYYFVVLFFKTPIPLLLAFFTSLFLFIKKKEKETAWNATVLLLPIIFFLVYFNFFYNSQVGIRHILMILPLMQVFSGLFFKKLLDKNRMIVIAAIVFYSITTFYHYFPYLIPYTNEFIIEKKMAYKKIADSNLDYHQSSGLLKKYIEDGKAVYAPDHPAAGIFIIDVDDLIGVKEEKDYNWLRKNYKPSGHLAFTYLIFEVSKESLSEKNLLQR